jgi:hypothetical protein
MTDTPPDNASQTLARGGLLSPSNVIRSTALGRTTTYAVTWDSTGNVETSSIKDPAGFTTTTVTGADHSDSTTYPDGTSVATTTAPDPRFGMDAYSVGATIKTPGGLMRTVAESRTATMASATNVRAARTLIWRIARYR